jgi:hypothetical protein
MPDERPGPRGGPQPGPSGLDRPPAGLPPSRTIPGDIGWKPDERDVDRSGGPESRSQTGSPGGPRDGVGTGPGGGPGLALRLLSIVPFVVGGVVGVVALLGWALLFVFGAGDQETLWAWVSGRPTGEVVAQVALVLALGVACVAVTVLAMWAGLHAFQVESGVVFWTSAQLVYAALAIGMVLLDRLAPEAAADTGLGAVEWWLLFAFVGFGLVVARLRARAVRPVNGRRDGRDAAG